MKPNDGCALQINRGTGWQPMALRHLKLSTADRRQLNQGETVEHEGAKLRRFDWQERQALHFALLGQGVLGHKS